MRVNILAVAGAVLAGAAACMGGAPAAKAPGKGRVFELRTYTASPGRIDALHARFRDHTNGLFVRHGMEVVGYWTPTSGENADRTLVYVLAYPSAEAREASWKAFRADPAWQKAKAESEKDGVKLAEKVESVLMVPTDYSPMR